MIEACDSWEKLKIEVKLFNINFILKECNGNDYICHRFDNSPNLVTIEKIGPLGCGCEQQPKEDWHFQCMAVKTANLLIKDKR
jgi:hypothetical protein